MAETKRGRSAEPWVTDAIYRRGETAPGPRRPRHVSAPRTPARATLSPPPSFSSFVVNRRPIVKSHSESQRRISFSATISRTCFTCRRCVQSPGASRFSAIRPIISRTCSSLSNSHLCPLTYRINPHPIVTFGGIAVLNTPSPMNATTEIMHPDDSPSISASVCVCL